MPSLALVWSGSNERKEINTGSPHFIAQTPPTPRCSRLAGFFLNVGSVF